MYDSTFLWRVTTAVHEDRVHALRQPRQADSRDSGRSVHHDLGLYRRLVCRLRTGLARVAPRTMSPN